jgi:hypothetical protein
MEPKTILKTLNYKEFWEIITTKKDYLKSKIHRKGSLQNYKPQIIFLFWIDKFLGSFI